ncbi:hypothetical protein W97_00215 [Coniosporium apollinis CBS 100218]|uniref:C2H2-type domain-containing protein n=1 Tax=Coniosporium apollinis (strain CBS 100218) TaxID=1168221 RepID=R7YGI5_CONA1|nr:uncharacterized protein W97_00215 [Coniosporium apollinis CBS 100218]EON61005.1 hypothetical protein W97_00215 [Coniosporium apollinis CBS 100218]
MEVHNPTREYPNPCEYKGCTKKFVRKTCLLRHEQSVHVKSRNWQCPLCDACFARKDTLRRHTEDGCPKRFELRHSAPASNRPSPLSNPAPIFQRLM